MSRNQILDAISNSSVVTSLSKEREGLLRRDYNAEYYEAILKRVIELCDFHQITPDELLTILESGTVQRPLQEAFASMQKDSPELRSRKARPRSSLPVPDARADSEINRRDTRIISRIPQSLITDFNRLVGLKENTTAKAEFERALEHWLTHEPSREVIQRAAVEEALGAFQVRVSDGLVKRINVAAAQREIRKKTAISQVLAGYLVLDT